MSLKYSPQLYIEQNNVASHVHVGDLQRRRRGYLLNNGSSSTESVIQAPPSPSLPMPQLSLSLTATASSLAEFKDTLALIESGLDPAAKQALQAVGNICFSLAEKASSLESMLDRRQAMDDKLLTMLDAMQAICDKLLSQFDASQATNEKLSKREARVGVLAQEVGILQMENVLNQLQENYGCAM